MNLYQKLSKYPKWGEWRNRPLPEKEGTKQGKPCKFCGKMTNGKRFVKVNFFRGDDELVAVCSEHTKNSPIFQESSCDWIKS